MSIVISGDGTMQQMASGGITGGATLVAGTAVSTTSGTAISFTGIPSWAKRITILLNQVTTNTSAVLQVQVGSGSYSTTGYASQYWLVGTYSGVTTSGFILGGNVGYATGGIIVLSLIGANTWVQSGALGFQNTSSTGYTSIGSSPALSGALDRVQITTVAGTPTFASGTINILYE